MAMHYETGLIVGMHADEDGDANDVRFVPDLLPAFVLKWLDRCCSWRTAASAICNEWRSLRGAGIIF